MHTKSVWNGFERIDFKFEGKNAIVVFADKSNRTDKWLLKTEYFGAFPETEIMLLKKGYNLAHIDNETRWCLESDTDRQASFCKFLADKFCFNEKCALVGMSCGGMQAVYLSAKYPQLVSVMYLDAPVINFLSCPAGFGKANDEMFDEFYNAKGLSKVELLAYRNHPLDKFSDLEKSNIPTILVSGDSDKIVPFDENGKYLYDFGMKNDMNITLYLKTGGDHHPHGLENNKIIADFIKKYY